MSSRSFRERVMEIKQLITGFAPQLHEAEDAPTIAA
jgi:hypothetical protein